GNSATANDAGAIDLTAPSVTVDAPALTNDSTPTITGTTNLPAGSTVSLVVTDANGIAQNLTATVAAGGTYSVDVPAALAEGNFTVLATATDAAGNSATANDAGAIDLTAPTVTLTLDPVTADNVLSATEAGGSVVLSGVAGGDAAAGDIVVLAVNGQSYQATVGAGGSFSVSVPGSALAADPDTRVDASITLTDAAGNSSTATAGQLYSVNTPPAGTDRTVSTAEDTAYQFAASDFGYTDTNGQPLAAVRIDSLPAAGQLLLGGVAVVAGQSIAAADLANLSFVPATDANGSGYASFSFSVSDGIDFDAAPNQLTIDVTPANDAPIAQPEAFTVAEDAAVVSGAVTATDVDAGATLIFALNGPAPSGLSFNANGTYSFDPAVAAYQSLGAGQSTVITVPYTVTDNAGASSGANLVITVTGTNDAPVAVVDTGSVNENATITATAATGVLSNDTDIDTGDARTVSAVSFGATGGTVGSALAGTYGTLTLNADGSYSYAASQSAAEALAGGQVVTETFSYTVRDNAGATSTTTLTFTITGTDDAPTITGPLAGSVQEDTTLSSTGTLVITDADAGQSGFQAQTGTPGTYGSFSITAAGVWTYTLANAAANVQALPSGAAPTETFTVTTVDGTTRTITITVNGTDDAAVISAGTGAVTEDVAVTGGNLGTSGTLTVTDIDTGQAGFQPQVATPGTYGIFTLAASGAWTYNASNANPAIQALGAGQSLTDTFTVRSVDGTTSTVTVTINGSNDGPVAQAAGFSVAEDAAVVTGAVTATDIDNGDTLTFALNGAAPAGLTFNANGTYSFNPAVAAYQSLGVGQQQIITVPYTVTDSAGATSTANLVITVTGTNDAPVANANTGPATEDTALTIVPGVLLANDTDVDNGTTLTITSVQSPVNGAVALVGGNVVFTPTANYSGPASFTYTISDGQGGSSTATVTLNVAAVADAPTLVAPTQINTIVQGASTASTEPGITQATLESTLGLASGALDGFAPPAGSTTNDPGNVNVIDGKSSNYTLELGAGNVASFNWQFFNGEDTTSEINGGYNDLIVLVVTDPNGVKQLVQLTSSEQTGRNTNGAAADATGTYNFTATTAGEYQFSWLVLNGGDGGKDSSMTVSAPTVSVGGTVYGQPIDLAISAGLSDRDGSESLSAITISGVPSGFALSAGTSLGGGSWSVTAAQLAGLKLLPASGFTGSFDLNVSVTSTEASNGSTATSTQSIAVTISSTTANQAGTQNADTISGTAANDSLQGFAGNDTINAGDGNDLVYGGDGNDTIDGGNGNDMLYGGAGSDIVSGGAGADRIQGGAGNDTLTGGTGADVFAWALADRGTTAVPAVDTITDFNVATPATGGDVLDLRDLLSGENLGNLANFIHFSTDGTSTTIQISSTGAFSGSNYGTATDQTIVLQNVNLFSGGFSSDQQIIQDLLNKSKLVVDG
ncbi:MAG: beta strand repeat-containing protein, partial [Piscinibacter sp.]|uniref:beta strand repeat-containing protein n=1 Tax=Piscinibacter sp. TaxID=1903157 RepID=UPI003D0AA932